MAGRLFAYAGQRPARLVAVGYAANMALGFLLLSLPISAAAPSRAIDDLFIAVSAVSTTGLVPVDPGSTYSRFGQAVILVMIQAGGLGFMTASSFAFAVLTNDAPSPLRGRVTRAVFSLPASVAPRVFVLRVVVYTAIVEAAGAGALAWLFAARGVESPLWQGVFHSVSAFCTAGFSLFATSFEAFAGDAPVLLVIAVLSILGAVGFLVASEAWDRVRGRITRLSLSTRLILAVTAIVLVLGTAVLALAEPSITAMPAGQRLLNAFFQAMTASTTVGFNAIPTAPLGAFAVTATYIMMLIGASPSGTGGGLKSTTVAVQWAFMLAVLRGRREVTLFGTAVPEGKLRQALATFFMAATLLAAAMLALSLTETLAFDRLLFEAISALGTVGLSLGVTGELSDAGKAVICLLMYAGRVGVLAFGVALAVRARGQLAGAREEDVAL
ncbi:TrkH family potassium uptake protein [Elioraea rosea]|uniref:TrkH family potassium uptake protein n=1 Tax=Elioraea rosea TaxID=2492390 RepID=UPI0011823278|nr:potassium transporter TrkG [Elioraea rosea]